MSDGPALVYLEAEDEITSVVRRVRVADATRVLVVAPGRSRATSSAVALRLLARAAADGEREVVVVGDALTRSLAAEAGLAAFASVEEARMAAPGAPPADASRHASIHVVRGPATDDTVAAPAVRAVPPPLAATDETRAVPIAPRAPARRAPRRAGRLGLLLGAAAALLVGGIAAGATLLPAATITVAPRTIPVSETYELVVEDARRESGTVETTATVTATGSYPILEAARGSVVIFNWTFFPVEVPSGTFVAAGRQAFATQETITVPRGRLTAQGTIAAGEQSVAVVAAAPGPDANVAARAINTVVHPQMDARLGGVPENPQPRVLNPEPTSGGTDTTGPEITEADVQAGVDELRAELDRRADEERPELGDLRVVDAPQSEPVIDVPGDLVGTRDVAETEISGTLAWEVVAFDPTGLEEEAVERLAADDAVPAGHELLPDSVGVELGTPVASGEQVSVPATVEGSAAPGIDPDVVRSRVMRQTEAGAEQALAELGAVDVALWPGWVASVPEFEWRIEVRIEEPTP